MNPLNDFQVYGIAFKTRAKVLYEILGLYCLCDCVSTPVFKVLYTFLTRSSSLFGA